MTGDCQGIEIRVTGSLTLNGVVRNTCTAPPAGSPPDIKLVVDGELTIGSSVSAVDAIVSSGSVRIADTATENVDLTPPAGPFAASFSWTAVSGAPAATTGNISGGATLNKPIRAGSGASVRTTRDGPLTVAGLVEAGNGADAPAKTQGPICDNSTAIGGNGGSVSLVARGNTLTLAAGATIRAGNGGKGGSCIATGCPVAQATGGKGGDGAACTSEARTSPSALASRWCAGTAEPAVTRRRRATTIAAPCADGCSAVA